MSDFEEEIDREIINSCDEKWRKVAMIIARVLDKHENDTTADEIATSIERLIADGKLESIGNTKNWRTSEVRRLA